MNKMPNDWVETTLGEVVEIKNEKLKMNNLTLDNYISTENLLPDRLGVQKSANLPNVPSVNAFKKDDTLFSNIRTYFKKVWFAKFDGGASNDVLIFTPKDESKLDKNFLYYFISSDRFIDFTVISAKGTKMPRGDKEAMKTFSFSLPPLPEQKAIAGVLSAFDEKIELLREQNKTLEEMGQVIFQEWCLPPRQTLSATPPDEGNYSPPVEECPKGEVVFIKKRNTLKYMSLPYNPELKEKAKSLRKAGNLAEVLLWEKIKNKQLNGFDFDRQKIIGNYIVDFFCANLGLIIEIDGSSHNNKGEYDEVRDNYLKSLGLGIIHIKDSDIRYKLKDVLDILVNYSPSAKGWLPKADGVVYKYAPKGEVVSSVSLKQKYTTPTDFVCHPSTGGELPVGWRVGKLGEVCSLKSGFAFGGDDFVEKSNTMILKIKDLKGNGIVDLSDISFVKDEVKKLERVQYFKLKVGDIVLAMSGNTTGKIGVIPNLEEDLFLNQRVGKFFINDEKYKTFIYFFLMSGNYEEKILAMGYGSAQPNINPTQIENIDIIYPDNEILENFINTTTPIFTKILDNLHQIQSLARSRDELLPRLMSGVVRVNF